MIIDGLLTLLIRTGANMPFTVDHNQDVPHTKIRNPLIEFAKILFVLCLILEELIYVFKCEDIISFFGVFWPIHIGHFTTL